MTIHAPAGTTPQSQEGATVLELSGASVLGPRGPVFGPLDAVADRPITMVWGRRGSGRTSLLLAAAGRMRIDSGTICVLGVDAAANAREVRRIAGIAGFDAIDQLEPQATVAEAIRERLHWISPWYRKVAPLAQADLESMLEPVFGPLPLPEHDCLTRDLSEADEMLVRIALALLEAPRIVMVDDLDCVKDPSEREVVAHRIAALASQGTFFVIGSADKRDATLFSPTSVAIVALDA